MAYATKTFRIDASSQDIDTIVNTWLTANPSITNPAIEIATQAGSSIVTIVILHN